MDRELALNIVRVTEAAALGCGKYMGRGNKEIADQAAVDGMRSMFQVLDIAGTVVIGEGELDEAPMLYIGEKIGTWEDGAPEIDIAVDPLDGTKLVAKGLPGALAVVAVAPKGCLLHAPDMYMDKIAVGPKAAGCIDITASIEKNLYNVAKALCKDITEVTVIIQDRERHSDIINRARSIGARIKLFGDGDVAAAIATCFSESGVDMFIGKGGAPEGVISAAALKCLGGEFQGILRPENDEEKRRCKEMAGDADWSRVLTMEDLARGNDIIFAATGVSDGELLKGVRYMANNRARTSSMVTRSKSGTIRFIDTTHVLDKKPKYAYVK
ncbi:class II fructose-bisphosphatase [Sedimentibacter hydroxybenzoicus DSM 7310]|uniref:Fructose-1,6-bisphosphatase n=1 Tax=Sedimentibacter hydroxybenzoicus DSM 7310 TaxID=1123245 RepID=A0A974GXD5_SEDHY|nr:class II fructose-bisphosphatase [Sedimentibacter hydroxybenzoicus]NYB75096.1 class II fructose-bisphosphatase [Sedimentibacter hydroxybenzoicus DSM 7310]